MFNSTEFDGQDLIFKDSTVKIVPTEGRTTSRSWLGRPFLDSLEGLQSLRCSGAGEQGLPLEEEMGLSGAGRGKVAEASTAAHWIGGALPFASPTTLVRMGWGRSICNSVLGLFPRLRTKPPGTEPHRPLTASFLLVQHVYIYLILGGDGSCCERACVSASACSDSSWAQGCKLRRVDFCIVSNDPPPTGQEMSL